MKKILSMAVVFAVAISAAHFAFAQDGPGQGRQGRGNGRFFAEARNEDGSLDLSKILASDRIPEAVASSQLSSSAFDFSPSGNDMPA